ncbi:hypothetical protein TRFO_01871 [Tritrichomonas foetus]|uniref:Uncharacterized protein n=1 Tax=Tritrichomonas foetus TaxID=1144522 RepID=A0A1J4JMQ0_9EUKA|nr:hypothetical protein TRFO_01871 [Tritrichomonas foetus]|eukprot:OHS98811.1 hypothetical protein TRFO_01871 [Tritrichomonas foetus]
MAEKENEYEGPAVSNELREKQAKRFINFYTDDSFSEVKYEQVKEKLDLVLTKPINLISSIVAEEEGVGEEEIKSIVFPPLQSLATQIYERKQSGENSKEIAKMKEQIETLTKELEEVKAAKEKRDAEFEAILNSLTTQCEKSPNGKVQGLTGAIKSATDDRPRLIETVIVTLNNDIKQKASVEKVSTSKINDLEKLIFHLKASNSQLQSDIEKTKKRYEANLEEARADYERKIEVLQLENSQNEGFLNFREALNKAKQDMMDQISQQKAKTVVMDSPAKDDSAKREMNEKLDTMMAKIEESQRKNELFEECLRSLQNTLSTVDGETLSTSLDFAERTKSIQKRLMNLEEKSQKLQQIITSSETVVADIEAFLKIENTSDSLPARISRIRDQLRAA